MAGTWASLPPGGEAHLRDAEFLAEPVADTPNTGLKESLREKRCRPGRLRGKMSAQVMEADDKTAVRAPASVSGERSCPCLIVLSGRSVGCVFQLSERSYVIGRGEDAQIAIDDDGVSRRHVKLICYANSVVVLKDLGSTNGTFVNGEAVTTRALADGDRIQVGATAVLKFSVQDALEAQFQHQLYLAATRDPLTKAYNRRFFEEQLEQDYSYSKRHAAPLSLAIGDLDHFKQVNDVYGHQAGDFVLREFVKLVSGMVRNEDTLYRVGGEEFAVLMRGTNLAGAMVACERLRAAVERQGFEYRGAKLHVTLSFGVAELDVGRHDNPAEFVQQADSHLYAAKAGGRNQTRGPT
jgi:two-component system cell cycle response regulator